MIVSHQHKFIFIKTRKTAGSSLESILYNYLGPDDICTGSEGDGTPRLNTNLESGHVGCAYFQKNYKQPWNDYFTFAVERNPWDKMVSHYFFLRAQGSFKARRTFTNFVLDFADRYTDWGKYAAGDGIKVDKVFKYETLDIDLFRTTNIPYNRELTKIFKKSGLRPGKAKDYKKFYDTISKKKVKEVFHREIKTFHYRFD